MRVPTNKGTIRTYGRYYVVQFGDTLYSVSQRFDASVQDLWAYNEQLGDSELLYPGEVLFIPDSSRPVKSKTAGPKRRRSNKR